MNSVLSAWGPSRLRALRVLLALFVSMTLTLTLSAILTLATDLHRPHQGTAHDSADFPCDPDHLALIGPGEVVWHFVLTQPEADSGTITAEFENAGTVMQANADSPANVLHFFVITDVPDTLLDASTDVDGGNLVLSNICFIEAEPTPTPTPEPTPTPTEEPTPTPTPEPSPTPTPPPADVGDIMIHKWLCEEVDRDETQLACAGPPDTSLAGWHIDFEVFEGTDTTADPIDTITVTLGENHLGQGNVGGGALGIQLGGPYEVGTYTVCEIPIAYDDETNQVQLLADPRPAGTNQTQVGELCIEVELTPGTAVLTWVDARVEVITEPTPTPTPEPTPTPTPEPSPTPTVEPTPTPTVEPTPTPTVEPTPTPTVEPTPTPTVEPTPTPTVEPTPTPTEEPSPTPTPPPTDTAGTPGPGSDGRLLLAALVGMLAAAWMLLRPRSLAYLRVRNR